MVAAFVHGVLVAFENRDGSVEYGTAVFTGSMSTPSHLSSLERAKLLDMSIWSSVNIDIEMPTAFESLETADLRIDAEQHQ